MKKDGPTVRQIEKGISFSYCQRIDVNVLFKDSVSQTT